MVFSKLSEKFKTQDFNFESLLAKINLDTIKGDSVEAVRNTIRSIDDRTKAEIHDWISRIDEIKKDTLLSEEEKQKKLSEIKTSETILKFLQSLIKVLANKIPIENKRLIETGITGIGVVASILNIELSGVALIAFSKGLPKFLMSDKFDQLSQLVINELK